MKMNKGFPSFPLMATIGITNKSYRIKQSFLILYLIVQTHVLFSQTADNRTPVMPPSPTSSVFSRYGENQPSLQTGAVNIPISLFNVKADGIDIPLSVTYQTSGINVMDTPYPAGYGWVFSSGFRITRTILGRPDERFSYRILDGTEDYQILKRGIVSEQIYNVHQLNESDLFDTQKDIFTLHLPSGNYKFFLNKVGSTYEAISVGHQIKIDVLSGFTGFKVTDEKGIIYMFGYDGNTSFLDFTEPSEVGGSTAWTLREIILLNNEKISFSWERVNINGFSVETNTPITIKDYKKYVCYGGNSSYEVEDPGGMISHFSYSYANVLMLKKIEYPNGVVDLTYKSTQDPFLQTIVAKNKNNEVVKTINFSYGPNNMAQDNLLLQSMNVNGEVYSFQYNSNRFYKNSTALDYWGFYNGKTTNVTLIPKMTIKLYTGLTQGGDPTPNINEQVGYADRSISEAHMKAFMLTRITYPTGGYSEYEYESHKFIGYSTPSYHLFTQVPAPISEGGGLRVSQIKSYTSAGSTPIVKIYKYGLNEDGLANNNIVPTLDTFVDEFWNIDQEQYGSCQFFYKYRFMRINALSNYSKFLINQNPIWYPKVTEYLSDFKTEYVFTHVDDNIIQDDHAKVVLSTYVQYYNNLFNSGPQLYTNTTFKKNGSVYEPVKKIVTDYGVIDGFTATLPYTQIDNHIIDRNVLFSFINNPGPDFYNDPSFYFGMTNENLSNDIKYHLIPYSIYVRSDILKKVSTIMYHNGDPIISSEEYTHNTPSRPSQLIKTEKRSSITGKEVSTTYKYANHFSDAVSQLMVTKNMLAPVIEESTTTGTTLVKKVTTNYTNNTAITNGLILPSSVLSLYSSAATPNTEVIYEKYDTKGNVVQLSPKNEKKVSYSWSYNGQYPVAEVKNATKAEIAYSNFEVPIEDMVMPGTVKDWTVPNPGNQTVYYSWFPNDAYTGELGCKAPSINSKTLPSGNYQISFYAKGTGSITVNDVSVPVTSTWKYYPISLSNITSVSLSNPNGIVIDDLRLHPVASPMTTYTYKPLIGMTSMTDARGQTTYYEYDAFNRLKCIKDSQKNIVKNYEYHYKP